MPETDQQSQATQKIQVGSRLFQSRHFLAPLAGYTQLPLRMALRELGGIGLATTDLVLAHHLTKKSKKSHKLIETMPGDRPLSVQIFGGRTHEIVNAAKYLADLGYEGIDLNMGCPMAKVNGQGGGARLMCDADNAVRMVSSVVEAVDLPVSVKMRLGWDADLITAPQLARAFEQVGIVMVTIHGRTRQQGFHGSVDLDGIASVVAAVDSIPVVGNGDVRTVEDALRMHATTRCDAIAIGRGALLDPWIFSKLRQHELGRPTAPPTKAEQLGFLRRHFQYIVDQHEEWGCTLFRKFAAWYGAVLGIPEDLEDRMRRLETPKQFDELLDEISTRHGERQSEIPTALIRTPNGPIDKW